MAENIIIERSATLGKIKRVEIVINSYLKKYDRVSVSIKKFSETKTQQQLRLYHGKWVPEAAAFTGDDRASIHRDFKYQHLHPILMEKREGFSELVGLLVDAKGDIDESRKLYAMYRREMSLGVATKDEVRLFTSALKHFFIHEWQWTGFTDPAMQGLV